MAESIDDCSESEKDKNDTYMAKAGQRPELRAKRFLQGTAVAVSFSWFIGTFYFLAKWQTKVRAEGRTGR